METKEIIFLLGIIVGAILLLGVLYTFIKNKSLGAGGQWIIIAGIILFGLSIWHKFEFSGQGISFETYNDLKENYLTTVKQVDEIKKEKNTISEQYKKLKAKLQSSKNDTLSQSLNLIESSTEKIDENINKIDNNSKIMDKKFENLDKKYEGMKKSDAKDKIEKK